MLGIEGICNAITNLFKGVRPPAKQVSRLLLVCSMIKRPGLSVIQSTANVTKTLSMLGIPTDRMPDGSENMTIAVVHSVITEVFRALKMDASVQVGFQPGSLSSIGVGGNAGGPVTVVSRITNPGQGFGTII
jgi:hypothetical protein